MDQYLIDTTMDPSVPKVDVTTYYACLLENCLITDLFYINN